jgi:predicted acetyltransferase
MRQRLATTCEDPSVTIYGLFREGNLMAGMLIYEFMMNVRGTFVQSGGLGSLAVDLLHRKQKLGKEMVSFYLRRIRDHGASIALLYPFRHDFYKRMGFGYGTKMNQYVFRPEGIRRSGSWEHVEYLTVNDAGKVLDCYDRFAAATHGMILGSKGRVEQMLNNPSLSTVGFTKGSRVLGYLTYGFEKRGNFLQNDLSIKQMVYESPEVLNELLSFLRSLADQFARIVVNTQDDAFHHLLGDPGNRSGNLLPSVFHESNTQGLGLMYRVIDLPGVFSRYRNARFGSRTCRMKITVKDSFMAQNDDSVVVHFKEGLASVVEGGEFDAEIRLDIADFSSMFMGVIKFNQLAAYGLAQVEHAEYAVLVNRLFETENRPICMTTF